jgi:hypothetical protein
MVAAIFLRSLIFGFGRKPSDSRVGQSIISLELYTLNDIGPLHLRARRRPLRMSQVDELLPSVLPMRTPDNDHSFSRASA